MRPSMPSSGDRTVGCTAAMACLHIRELAGQELPTPNAVTLLIGPEGGLSDAEIDAAEGAGFQSLALGPRVLRTETAPVAALSILQFHWGDMQ